MKKKKENKSEEWGLVGRDLQPADDGGGVCEL